MWEWLAASWTELLGFATGLICVILAARRNVWTFPIGIANNLVFVVLFVSAGIYASAVLQVVFLVFGVHGWWRWTRKVEQDAEFIGTTPRRAIPVLILAGVAGTLVLWWALETFTDSHVAVADATTTAASLVAQYMLNRKWIQNWFVWAGVDILFAALTFSQGLWLTGILYLVFLGICVTAWWSWRGRRAAQLRASDEAVRA